MENPIGRSQRVSLNTAPSVHIFNHSTPVSDLHPSSTFYHHILQLARQCQFENIDEHFIEAIVFGCKSKKAQDKLFQMPIRMTIEECLLICHHYKSLQFGISTLSDPLEITV